MFCHVLPLGSFPKLGNLLDFPKRQVIFLANDWQAGLVRPWMEHSLGGGMGWKMMGNDGKNGPGPGLHVLQVPQTQLLQRGGLDLQILQTIRINQILNY